MTGRIGTLLLVSFLTVGCSDVDLDQLTCTDAFRLTGSFVASQDRPELDPNSTTTPPERFTGCWPVGTWTFTASLDSSDENILDVNDDQVADRCGRVSGTKAATVDASYRFTVTRADGADGAGPQDSYTLEGAVQESTGDGERLRWNGKHVFRLKVTEGGGGECEGGLELFGADGKSYWNLKPALTDTVISGAGDFKLFEHEQI